MTETPNDEATEEPVAQEHEYTNPGDPAVEDVDDYAKYQPAVDDDEPSSIGEYIEDTIEDPEPDEPVEQAVPEEPEEQIEPEESKEPEEVPTFVDETVQPIFIDEQNEPTVFFGDEPLQPVQEPVFEPEPAPAPEPAREPIQPEPQIYHRTYIINESAEPAEQHAPRRPVSSVFNLNDKFRFRRELFGNSDAQYVECLDILSAMKSLDEAKEYLYEDLKWDAENEDVKAFVELLSNYYR